MALVAPKCNQGDPLLPRHRQKESDSDPFFDLVGNPCAWLIRETRDACAQTLPPPVNRNDAKSQFKSLSIELLGEQCRLL